MAMPAIGAQLLVFRGKYDFETDTDLILDAVAEAGYEGIEGSLSDPMRLKAALDARGLRHGGIHTDFSRLADIAPFVRYKRTTGVTNICTSGLFDGSDWSLDAYVRAIDFLNDAGRKLRSEGLALHYHHHAIEFEIVDGGRTGMDVLLEGLHPDAVSICVDVGWMYRADIDAARFMLEHQERIGYVHLKDTTAKEWRELGTGKVNLPAIVAALPLLPNIRWAMIEQDSTRKDPVVSATESRAYLREAFGI